MVNAVVHNSMQHEIVRPSHTDWLFVKDGIIQPSRHLYESSVGFYEILDRCLPKLFRVVRDGFPCCFPFNPRTCSAFNDRPGVVEFGGNVNYKFPDRVCTLLRLSGGNIHRNIFKCFYYRWAIVGRSFKGLFQ